MGGLTGKFQPVLCIRVDHFSKGFYIVPSFGRGFHLDTKNGLLSALRRILKMHSVPDGKPFLALDHFFRLATLNYKLNTTFGSKVFSENCFVQP